MCKIWSKVFNITKKWLHSTETSNQSSMFVFFSTSHFLAVIILQPETVKLNVTNS